MFRRCVCCSSDQEKQNEFLTDVKLPSSLSEVQIDVSPGSDAESQVLASLSRNFEPRLASVKEDNGVGDAFRDAGSLGLDGRAPSAVGSEKMAGVSSMAVTVGTTLSRTSADFDTAAHGMTKELVASDFPMLLRTGRLFEAEQLAKRDRTALDKTLLAWLDEELVLIRSAIKNLSIESATDGDAVKSGKYESAYRDVPLPEIDAQMHYRRKKDGVEFHTVMKLPARMQDAVAINFEIDLNSQWMPFNPTAKADVSARSSTCITHTAFKIPAFPGTREIYTYRMAVDCLGSEAVAECGRPGMLFIDRSPDCWKAGGRFKDEFDIPPPPPGWVTRDQQRLSVAFWEPLTDGSSSLTLWCDIVFNVPRWIFPDALVVWLLKTVAKTSQKNLSLCFRELDNYGFEERVRQSRNPIYNSVVTRQEELHRAKAAA